MLGKMLRNFFQEVHWGTLDVVLLDLPPGTGDMALDVHNMFPRSKELIVTTPQQTAADVAIRAGLMALHTKHEILGVIENMAFYQCKGCGERTYLFGQGGGAQVADGLQTSVLAQIPMGEPMEGTQGIFARDSLQGQAFDLLAQQVASDLRLEALAAARE
ncbi:P-loop NTPase [Ferroacidibacillus organovorans]|uniref:P-loop NTPase n=1 Tax=Ferroacidibacillus organovorans TaxID=1765683 RepID=UPI003012F1B5